jgi:hypothetical protein
MLRYDEEARYDDCYRDDNWPRVGGAFFIVWTLVGKNAVGKNG